MRTTWRIGFGLRGPEDGSGTGGAPVLFVTTGPNLAVCMFRLTVNYAWVELSNCTLCMGLAISSCFVSPMLTLSVFLFSAHFVIELHLILEYALVLIFA